MIEVREDYICKCGKETWRLRSEFYDRDLKKAGLLEEICDHCITDEQRVKRNKIMSKALLQCMRARRIGSRRKIA